MALIVMSTIVSTIRTDANVQQVKSMYAALVPTLAAAMKQYAKLLSLRADK